MTKTIGNFQLSVANPYPVWIEIRMASRSDAWIKLSHHELDDLAHVVSEAKRHARLLLKEDRDEVSSG